MFYEELCLLRICFQASHIGVTILKDTCVKPLTQKRCIDFLASLTVSGPSFPSLPRTEGNQFDNPSFRLN